ncbi:MAG: hypothetical protein KTR18_08125 [Acidiferrobacterales bacterium]|nr:hypothetical protein [Acidiferrobacterales bacterium]
MILLLLSAFFCWLIFRELRNPYREKGLFSLGYMLTLAVLAVVSALPAYSTWRLETDLSEKASIIADTPNVKVRCNSILQTMLGGKAVSSPAGTAYYDTNEIFFESGWCKNFKQYLRDPVNATREQLFSMHIFTHEVMHIRGERNEQKTDCQAIQRNHTVGQLLGIEESIARRNAKIYYFEQYPRHPYFHAECKPGGALDEGLTDSIWG